MAALPETTLHASLVRPILLGGAERELVILEGTAILILTLGAGFHVATLLLALFLGTVVHSLLVLAARRDPQMLAVYRRSLSYAEVYLARARPDAPAGRFAAWDRGR